MNHMSYKKNHISFNIKQYINTRVIFKWIAQKIAKVRQLICVRRRVASDEMADNIFASNTYLYIFSLSPSITLPRLLSLQDKNVDSFENIVVRDTKLWIYHTI